MTTVACGAQWKPISEVALSIIVTIGGLINWVRKSSNGLMSFSFIMAMQPLVFTITTRRAGNIRRVSSERTKECKGVMGVKTLVNAPHIMCWCSARVVLTTNTHGAGMLFKSNSFLYTEWLTYWERKRHGITDFCPTLSMRILSYSSLDIATRFKKRSK